MYIYNILATGKVMAVLQKNSSKLPRILLFLLPVMMLQALTQAQSWGAWGTWNCFKQNGFTEQRTRTSVCNTSDPDCSIQNETEIRDAIVYSWSPWSRWLPFCASAIQSRQRSCIVQQPVCQSSCGPQSHNISQSRVLTKAVLCCEDTPMSQWSEWSPTCAQLTTESTSKPTQQRRREILCPDDETCDECEPDIEHRNVSLLQWSQWGVWNAPLRVCSVGNRTRERYCEELSPADFYCELCNRSITQTETQCASSVLQWSSWGQWSGCDNGGNLVSRSRTCPSPLSTPNGVVLFLCNTSSTDIQMANSSSLCSTQRLHALLIPILSTVTSVALLCFLAGVLFCILCCRERLKRKSYNIVLATERAHCQVENVYDEVEMTVSNHKTEEDFNSSTGHGRSSQNGECGSGYAIDKLKDQGRRVMLMVNRYNTKEDSDDGQVCEEDYEDEEMTEEENKSEDEYEEEEEHYQNEEEEEEEEEEADYDYEEEDEEDDDRITFL